MGIETEWKGNRSDVSFHGNPRDVCNELEGGMFALLGLQRDMTLCYTQWGFLTTPTHIHIILDSKETQGSHLDEDRVTKNEILQQHNGGFLNVWH